MRVLRSRSPWRPGPPACRSESPTRHRWLRCAGRWLPCRTRSEEHTSELQSRLHLVCRLLLEKKKKSAKHTSQIPDRLQPAVPTLPRMTHRHSTHTRAHRPTSQTTPEQSTDAHARCTL